MEHGVPFSTTTSRARKRPHRTLIWNIGPTAGSKCSSRRRVLPDVLLNPSGPPISVATPHLHHQTRAPPGRYPHIDSTSGASKTANRLLRQHKNSTVSTKHTRDAKVPSAGTLLLTDITMLCRREDGKTILARATQTHVEARTRHRDETKKKPPHAIMKILGMSVRAPRTAKPWRQRRSVILTTSVRTSEDQNDNREPPLFNQHCRLQQTGATGAYCGSVSDYKDELNTLASPVISMGSKGLEKQQLRSRASSHYVCRTHDKTTCSRPVITLHQSLYVTASASTSDSFDLCTRGQRKALLSSTSPNAHLS